MADRRFALNPGLLYLSPAAVTKAAATRPAGYVAAILAAGELRPIAGRPELYLVLTKDQAAAIRARFPMLGDRIHRTLAPWVRLVDRIAGTRLAKCHACALRRAALNRLEERARAWWLDLTAPFRLRERL